MRTHRENANHFSSAAAVAGRERKRRTLMPILSGRVKLNKRHSPEQHTARRNAALDALNRIYCDVMATWRWCPKKSCKRHRRCSGDAWPCLQRALPQLPRGMHPQILAQVRAGGPRRVTPVNDIERDMRLDPPGWVK
jgi:hypothetical protein